MPFLVVGHTAHELFGSTGHFELGHPAHEFVGATGHFELGPPAHEAFGSTGHFEVGHTAHNFFGKSTPLNSSGLKSKEGAWGITFSLGLSQGFKLLNLHFDCRPSGLVKQFLLNFKVVTCPLGLGKKLLFLCRDICGEKEGGCHASARPPSKNPLL